MKTLEGKETPARCQEGSVVVESVVVAMTLLSSLATCWFCLLEFEAVTVLKTSNGYQATNSSQSSIIVFVASSNGTRQEIDEDLLDLMKDVCLYINFGIAALFLIEIFTKVTVFRKVFISKPYQIVDSLTVVANAAFQAVFYTASLTHVYYCFSFCIFLRLWRVACCYLCNLNLQNRRASLERDLESHIAEQFKVSQRNSVLEGRLSKQESLITGLRKQLSSYHNDVDSERRSIKAFHHNGAQSHKQKSRSAECRKDEHNFQDIGKNNSTIQVDIDTNTQKDNTSNTTSHHKSSDSTCKAKPRWRRSSTSEYLDLRLSLKINEETVSSFPPPSTAKSVSCSNLIEGDGDEISKIVSCSLEAVAGDDHFDLDGSIQTQFTHVSEDSEHPPFDDKDGNNNKNHQHHLHRQNSCPEYMFTQRTSVTKYESMLIDDYKLSHQLGFDNDGFSQGENGFPLVALSDMEELKTYRNQNGVPTTAL